MRQERVVNVIWVPLAGGGQNSGHRYREALRPLDSPELVQSYGAALGCLERLAADPCADLGEWVGHGPALSVYAQWAVYALRDRQLIDRDIAHARLGRLAQLQHKGGLGPSYPGIHYGKSSGWSAPSWWGGDMHVVHQAELIRIAPERYSIERFTP